jgi:hypothetical protein
VAVEPEHDCEVVARTRDQQCRVDRLRDRDALVHVVDPRRIAELELCASEVEQRFGPDLVGSGRLGHRERLLAEFARSVVATGEIRVAGALSSTPDAFARVGGLAATSSVARSSCSL